MDHTQQEQIALHRWAVIAEAASGRLTASERGALVRQIAARAYTHPDGSSRRYSRGTVGRWLRAWRAGGLAALRPAPRAGTGVVRAHPELFAEAAALRLELPGRPAAQIASILYHRHGITVAERTIRGQLRRAGLHRGALAAEPKAYGRYEAARPNERWISDVLVGPWVPFPKREGWARARLFLIVDDHSRLLVDGRFFACENARACQDLLRRAVTRRGLPEVFYCDNGAPFSNAWLARTCGVLGIRLVHSQPYSPQGRGTRKGSTAISARRSWPRPPTTASSPSTSSTTCSPPGPSRSPTGRRTPRPARHPSAGSRPAGRPARPIRGYCARRSAGR
jgi:putative transposase